MASKGTSWRDIIPKSNLFDTNYYDYVIEEPVIEHSNNGNKQYKCQCRITKPTKAEGQIYFARFTVGNEEDPEATDPESWKGFQARKLGEFLESIEAPDAEPATKEFDKMFLKLEGEKGCVFLSKNIQKKGQYAGTEQQTDKWYKLGDREAGSFGKEGNGAAAPARASRRQAEVVEEEPADEPPTARRARPRDDDDDDARPRRGAR